MYSSDIFRKCIVFIDDDLDMLSFLNECVKNSGYEVHSFSSADEAIKNIEEIFPSIVFIDYQMENMNGIELLKNIKSIIPEAVLIMLTGEGNEKVAVSAIKSGADDYLVKPVTKEQIHEVISQYLAKFFSCIINFNCKYDYPLNDTAISRYEFLRSSYSSSVKNIKILCKYFNYSRQDFYNYEKRFKKYGVVGLLKKRDFEKLNSSDIYFKPKDIKISSLNDFIDKNDEVQMKLEMFREAATDLKPNICDISNKYGFTREAYYQIYKSFKDDGLLALTEKKKGRPKKNL